MSLRDLIPDDAAPTYCPNCHWSRFQVVIVSHAAQWECSRCHHRPKAAPPDLLASEARQRG